MSTTLQKPAAVERRRYVIDAAGKPLGRTAALVATLLRGKNKATFTPNVDCGDHVIVINCKDAVLTGKKLDQKIYYHHSAYLSGLKATKARDLLAARPERVMYLAVKGMLPDNVLGRKQLTRLHAYADADHKNAAQKPEVYEG